MINLTEIVKEEIEIKRYWVTIIYNPDDDMI